MERWGRATRAKKNTECFCHATITTTEPSRRPQLPGWPRKRAHRGFVRRRVAVRLMGVTCVTTPPPERRTPSLRRSCDAHLSHRRASPCRPGREPGHQEGLPTRQASGGASRPTRTPKETAAQLEGPGRRKLSNHPHSSSTTERRNVAAVAHQGRRTYCGCTPDAANRVSNMAMAPCDNPAETCANHSLITSYSPPWRLWLTASKEETPAGVDGGRLPAGA